VRCAAYNRQATRCRSKGRFDHYHQAVLCDRHADMEAPALSAEQAAKQRQRRDNQWANKRERELEDDAA
jgi:hypothetical protein